MQYKITDTSVVRINETSGVIQNEGQYPLELSDAENFANVFVLDSGKTVSFKGRLYIRMRDQNTPHVVKANIVSFIKDGTANGTTATISNESVVSDNDYNDYMDGIFGGNG